MDCFSFDRVAGRCSRAVSLEVLASTVFQWVQSGLSISLTDQVPLRHSTRHRYAIGCAILVDASFSNDTVDMIAVFNCRAKCLENDSCNPIPSGVSYSCLAWFVAYHSV